MLVVAGLAVAGIAIAACAGVARPDGAEAGTGPDAGGTSSALGITVTGTGKVRAAPDQAGFSFGVETQGQTAGAAMAANNEAVQKVIDAVKGAGIDGKDVQTQQISVYPRYADDGQAIVGYSASNSVNVTIRDLAKVGAVVDAATKAGANQVSGPNLTISDQSALYATALEQALGDARSKAETIAKAAGVTLGRVVNIVEGGGLVPPIPVAEAADTAGGRGVPVEPGQQELQASLTVTFAIA
jgi:hypothetical protein